MVRNFGMGSEILYRECIDTSTFEQLVISLFWILFQNSVHLESFLNPFLIALQIFLTFALKTLFNTNSYTTCTLSENMPEGLSVTKSIQFYLDNGNRKRRSPGEISTESGQKWVIWFKAEGPLVWKWEMLVPWIIHFYRWPSILNSGLSEKCRKNRWKWVGNNFKWVGRVLCGKFYVLWYSNNWFIWTWGLSSGLGSLKIQFLVVEIFLCLMWFFLRVFFRPKSTWERGILEQNCILSLNFLF